MFDIFSRPLMMFATILALAAGEPATQPGGGMMTPGNAPMMGQPPFGNNFVAPGGNMMNPGGPEGTPGGESKGLPMMVPGRPSRTGDQNRPGFNMGPNDNFRPENQPGDQGFNNRTLLPGEERGKNENKMGGPEGMKGGTMRSRLNTNFDDRGNVKSEGTETQMGPGGDQKGGFMMPGPEGMQGNEAQGNGSRGDMGKPMMGQKGQGQSEEEMQKQQEEREKKMGEQRLKGIRNGIKGMEQGVKMLEKQVIKVEKQGVLVPAELKNNLAKAKTLIEIIKNAKTWEEVENAGIEDLKDIMEVLNEGRQTLEQWSRIPQMSKQMDRELKRFASELKKAKSLVDRLMKKDIDLNDVFGKFETAVNQLKELREKVKAMMQGGDPEDIFGVAEEFFDQVPDAWAHHKVIMMMSNLGRFVSEFSREIKSSEAMVRRLEKQKKDVAKLKESLAQAKEKGNEVIAMIKNKDIDEDVVQEKLGELEELRAMFERLLKDVTGEEWEGGPGGAPSASFQGPTCNVGGVELPGDCKNYQGKQ